MGFGVAVDAEKNAFLAGVTGSSSDFLVVNAAQSDFGSSDLLGLDAFVARFSTQNSLLTYATFLGGSGKDVAFDIAVDVDGSAYVVGETNSTDFPVTGAFQPVSGGGEDGFVVKLSPTGADLEFSSYLGGSVEDTAAAVALDPNQGVYVAGGAHSGNAPATFGALQTESRGGLEALITKIIPGDAATVTTVSAASFSGSLGVAPEAIASGFGEGLAPEIAVAQSVPLPTELAGTSVRITDSSGMDHLAPLFFVAPAQINYLIPADVAQGLASVEVVNGGQTVASGTVRVGAVAPGLFSADASGQGVAAAAYLRAAANGTRTQDFVFDVNTRAPVPIELGPEGDQVFLLLFGTGLRGLEGEAAATVGGEQVDVFGPVPQPEFVGLDQVNLGPLPRSLAGRGDVDIMLTLDGKTANTVTVNTQ